MSENETTTQSAPQRRSWLRFSLQSVLMFTLGIACAIAPFKLWEYSQPPTPQILLHFKVVEIDSNAEGVFWEGVIDPPADGKASKTSLTNQIEKLVAQKRAKVIAEPSMVTSSGEPAEFRLAEIWHEPGEIKIYSSRLSDREMSIKITGRIKRNGRISLSISPALAVQTLDAASVDSPTPRIRKLSTTGDVEVRPGESTMVSALWQHSHKPEGITGKGTIVVVTAEILPAN